jgi:hypothetical protein
LSSSALNSRLDQTCFIALRLLTPRQVSILVSTWIHTYFLQIRLFSPTPNSPASFLLWFRLIGQSQSGTLETMRSFNQRITQEHLRLEFRAKYLFFHYECIDSLGATHRFFLIAIVPGDAPEELVELAEATAIAVLNLNRKGSAKHLKVLQAPGVLDPSLKSTWALNRSHRLLDFLSGGCDMSLNERSDLRVDWIVKTGGFNGNIEEIMTKEQSIQGSKNAAKSKAMNNVAHMIQLGREFNRKNGWRILGVCGGFEGVKISQTENHLRLWIGFAETGRHQKRWAKIFLSLRFSVLLLGLTV